MKSIYLNQRIKKETVKRLRKYEKKNGLRPSVSATIDDLLDKCVCAEHCPECVNFGTSL